MKKMKIITNATLIILLMISPSLLFSFQPVNAQIAAQQPTAGPLPTGVAATETYTPSAYLSFRPNPIGLKQVVLVNIWTTTPPAQDRMQLGYVVTITKPDGTKQTIGPVNSQVNDGTYWFEFNPDQVGTWKLKFDFPGVYFPAGRYFNGYLVTNTSGTVYPVSHYFTPASTAEQNLTVQENLIASWPVAPLPTDYWTRPISPENREWWPISGNYPWHGPSGGGPQWDALYPNTNPYFSDSYGFVPWVQAPDSAHILWKRQGAIAGLIGGDQGIVSLSSGGGTPNIIFDGRCYQTLTKPMLTLLNGTYRTLPTTVWECYDLRTGQVYWDLTDVIAPTAIEYVATDNTGNAGASVSLLAISNGRLIKYNPYTGAVTANVSTGVLTSGTYYRNGYALTLQTVNATANNYRLINWTTLGTSTDFNSRIMNNITWPWANLGFGNGLQDFQSDVCVDVSWVRAGGQGTSYNGTRVRAASLTTGTQLWDNYVAGLVMFNAGSDVADHGKVAVLMDDGRFHAWNAQTGTVAWVSDRMDYPWDAPGFGAYDIASAYGMIFRAAYSGVYAFDWDTGKIIWKYEAPANPYETPYIDASGSTVYSFYGSTLVADGKVYTYNTEHTPTEPITRGWKLHCINATTGEGIWNITGPMTPGAVADGYLTASNSYDGYMYVFGKGESATSVSAPQTQVTAGTNAIISGTVLDQSPAQMGKACVSDDSMGTYMEYLHMQHPIDGIYHNITITGVPVSIDATDPNGNPQHLGDTTSDISGTFHYTWTPTIAGTYQITATFAGNGGYGSSWAETAAVVANAQPTQTPTQAQAVPDYTMTIIAGVIAIIIAVLIIGAVIVLILRKRP